MCQLHSVLGQAWFQFPKPHLGVCSCFSCVLDKIQCLKPQGRLCPGLRSPRGVTAKAPAFVCRFILFSLCSLPLRMWQQLLPQVPRYHSFCSLLKLFSSPGPLPGICAELGTALPPLCGFAAQGFHVFPVEPSSARLVFPTHSCLLLPHPFVGWGSQGISLAQPHL